jgi:hypothetical protein
LSASNWPADLDRVKLVLEAGMIVTYVRCFSGGSAKAISLSSDLPADLRTFHEELIERRNKVYAHTDPTELRQIVNINEPGALAAFIHKGEDFRLNEEWDSLTPAGLEAIGNLARVHYEAVRLELAGWRGRFRDAVPPPAG